MSTNERINKIVVFFEDWDCFSSQSTLYNTLVKGKTNFYTPLENLIQSQGYDPSLIYKNFTKDFRDDIVRLVMQEVDTFRNSIEIDNIDEIVGFFDNITHKVQERLLQEKQRIECATLTSEFLDTVAEEIENVKKFDYDNAERHSFKPFDYDVKYDDKSAAKLHLCALVELDDTELDELSDVFGDNIYKKSCDTIYFSENTRFGFYDPITGFCGGFNILLEKPAYMDVGDVSNWLRLNDAPEIAEKGFNSFGNISKIITSSKPKENSKLLEEKVPF